MVRWIDEAEVQCSLDIFIHDGQLEMKRRDMRQKRQQEVIESHPIPPGTPDAIVVTVKPDQRLITRCSQRPWDMLARLADITRFLFYRYTKYPRKLKAHFMKWNGLHHDHTLIATERITQGDERKHHAIHGCLLQLKLPENTFTQAVVLASHRNTISMKYHDHPPFFEVPNQSSPEPWMAL